MVIALMVRELIPPAIAVLVATIFLFLVGIIDARQAFSGFSNEAPIFVASLLVLARAVELSGLLEPMVNRLFGAASGTRALLARVVLPITGASAFLNNTTLVAMTVPPVLDLSRRRRLPASRFLIPISYGAVLGGVITTIGTSTNITVSGLLSGRGMPALDLFEITPVGLVAAVVGALALLIFAPLLLPDRGSDLPARVDAEEGGREFTVSMRVTEGGPLAGTSVESGGLRHLRGVFLVEIERDEQVIAPVGPVELLRGGDRLTFVGRVDDIVDLQRLRGLESTERTQLEQLGGGGHSFYEVVIGDAADLVGRTLKQIGFRARYNAAVLAIHRQGERFEGKLGEVRLRMGDTLLVLADGDFRKRWRESREFLVIAPLAGVPPTRSPRAPIVAAIAIGFILVTAFDLIGLLQAALLVPLLLVGTRAMSIAEARRAIDVNLIVLIAASFGLGAAVDSSGLATAIADGFVGLLGTLGPAAIVAAIYVATIALTELISNNAAAVLMFPIALAAAAGLGVDPRPFAITVLFGASLSFLTPIGYQTNMMVYGLGNYRFLDFTRVGVPVTLVAGLAVVLLVPLVYPLRPI